MLTICNTAFPLQNGCMNVPQCYVMCTLPVLLICISVQVLFLGLLVNI